MQSKKLSIK